MSGNVFSQAFKRDGAIVIQRQNNVAIIFCVVHFPRLHMLQLQCIMANLEIGYEV